VYSYRINDISLPLDSTGFVYMLVSVKDCSRTYVGQTENISKHLYQHNKGWGAVGTADPQYRPYAVVAYICGMGHMNRVKREGIEKKWKVYNHAIMQESSRVNDVMDRIKQGQRIVVEYNEDQLYVEMFIRFVITINRSSIIP
jgi:predicted GIY-YIG superfamily endonuclease